MSEIKGARRLFEGGNKLKLGVFGLNCKNGSNYTMAETAYVPTWDQSLAIGQRADQMGFEILIPLARWSGWGGESDPFGASFETMSWAGAIAAQTEQIIVVGTGQVPLIHPVFAAKQCATLDHIADGRFAFNAVMGWDSGDFAMFGMAVREHDERYVYGSEWMEVVRRIWTEDEAFDFNGKYFQLKNVRSHPKPLQDPYPLIINAGNSPSGLDFAAREADVNFAIVENLEKGKANVDYAKQKAAEQNRELLVLSVATVICRDSEDEAQSVVAAMREHADRDAVRNALAEFGVKSGSISSAVEEDWAAFSGSIPIVGTPEQVAQKLADLSGIGLDGITLASLDYFAELGTFNEKVMPLLVEMGLRDEVRPL